ncbi:glycolate oxidase [Teratosphaeria nubilosa]|uniref:Glycolate oxidase n=1 Tax=Teratosphaeria nubilosa TaxID=161662 RepID=A0A6G1LLI7_9PEZI|nr:glycolate oxidase [Teratosphaeria nubilosa]
MAHPEGELATARACARRSVNMAVSSFANYPIKQIRDAGLAVGPIKHAMQMYTMKDRNLKLELVKEAERNGCTAMLLTADSPVLGVRYKEWWNDFRTPAGLGYPIIGMESERLQKAIEMGCDGIIVSNHGGRQLDGVPATVDALPECVEAAAGRIRVHFGGGIRSGTDIFKALALGAEHVWVGRPAIWGLATFYNEFKRCMQLTGCVSVKDITKACVGVVRSDGPLARL